MKICVFTFSCKKKSHLLFEPVFSNYFLKKYTWKIENEREMP